MKELSQEKTLRVAAMRAEMSENTARRYRDGAAPKGQREARAYRTREDPFEEVWPDIEKMLEAAPGLEAKTIFEQLMERPGAAYTAGQLRTLQRKIRRWRAHQGPESTPGAAEGSDVPAGASARRVRAERLHLDERSKDHDRRGAFDHLVYHFMLPYSRWETGRVCFSESFEALIGGFQAAVGDLGRFRTSTGPTTCRRRRMI